MSRIAACEQNREKKISRSTTFDFFEKQLLDNLLFWLSRESQHVLKNKFSLKEMERALIFSGFELSRLPGFKCELWKNCLRPACPQLFSFTK